mmetsp:Transcript_4216/g.12803  ORF Transcript_4216/g.12803 Transcript_4216/m.12803 type:complete len:297 (-) Transcript_4216:65-955(-)
MLSPRALPRAPRPRPWRPQCCHPHRRRHRRPALRRPHRREAEGASRRRLGHLANPLLHPHVGPALLRVPSRAWSHPPEGPTFWTPTTPGPAASPPGRKKPRPRAHLRCTCCRCCHRCSPERCRRWPAAPPLRSRCSCCSRCHRHRHRHRRQGRPGHRHSACGHLPRALAWQSWAAAAAATMAAPSRRRTGCPPAAPSGSAARSSGPPCAPTRPTCVPEPRRSCAPSRAPSARARALARAPGRPDCCCRRRHRAGTSVGLPLAQRAPRWPVQSPHRCRRCHPCPMRRAARRQLGRRP